MTIHTGHDEQGHARRIMRRARIPVPGGPIKRPKPRQGITRQPRDRTAPARPLTERHQAILAHLDTTKPTRVVDIADALDLTRAGTTSSLYALQDRGFATRIPYKGWIKTPQTKSQNRNTPDQGAT